MLRRGKRRRAQRDENGLSIEEVRRLVDSVPFWWHSIDLGGGVVTPGLNSLDFLKAEWELLGVGDVRGRTVLDVGSWDGFFAFEAERHEASRVVALDHYVWSLDLEGQQRYWERCRSEGVAPEPYHETEYWRPHELPGKQGIDVAHRVLRSSVEVVVDDLMTCDIARLGEFDIVLYLGVLYHMEEPLESLKRIAHLTRRYAVISTQAIVVRGHEDRALVEFFPGAELNHDVSNWWAPNLEALRGLCRAAGFSDVRTIVGPPANADAQAEPLVRYRAVVHALK